MQYYRSYSSYLKKKYGGVAYRVGVDGGFSCPNRGIDRTNPGCRYCDVFGVRSAYIGEEDISLGAQVNKSLGVLRKRYKAEYFLLYFQAYSSTWASVNTLKKIYDEGLSFAPFRELIVSTRPDCVNEKNAGLLGSYKRDDFDVWVELGLQSACDESLEKINRGHGTKEFLKAFHLLRKVGVKIAVHLIFGLPGEDAEHIQKTAEFIREIHPEAIKIHNLHIPTGSPLYQEYRLGELSFPGNSRHLQYIADFLEQIHNDIIIMRLTTDTPGLRHDIPGNFYNKSRISNELVKLFRKRGSCQGSDIGKVEYRANNIFSES